MIRFTVSASNSKGLDGVGLHLIHESSRSRQLRPLSARHVNAASACVWLDDHSACGCVSRSLSTPECYRISRTWSKALQLFRAPFAASGSDIKVTNVCCSSYAYFSGSRLEVRVYRFVPFCSLNFNIGDSSRRGGLLCRQRQDLFACARLVVSRIQCSPFL
jgi:hypothetical protein